MGYKKNEETFYFHDYETFGIDSKRTRASQFAGIRTDKDLNILPEGENDKLNIYCELTKDYLPSPDACLVTGHTPQKIENIKKQESHLDYKDKTVFSEYYFARKINKVLSKGGTCGIGYNNINFDDEFSRNIFYRTLLDPYQREWQSGCSRADGMHFIRFAFLCDPNVINFPDKIFDDGEKKFYPNGDVVKSFKLEDLSAANGIEHGSAHDAMSDVYALIGVLKLIKDRRPDIFDYVYNNRRKKDVQKIIDENFEKPMLHYSSFYGADNYSMGVIKAIQVDINNPNNLITVNLLGNVNMLLEMSAEELKERLFSKKEVLENNGWERPPINMLTINKCPVISDLSWIKNTAEYFQLDGNKLRENLKLVKNNINIIKEKLSIIYEEKEYDPVLDVDLGIYDGFASNNDKNTMSNIHVNIKRGEFSGQKYDFENDKYAKLYFRFKARNFYTLLGVKETVMWDRFCIERVTGTKFDNFNEPPVYCKEFGEYTISSFVERLKELKVEHKDDKEKIDILVALYHYAKSLVPEHPSFSNNNKNSLNNKP